jgi:hypothetical protein
MDLNEYNEERQFIMENAGLPTIVLMRKYAEYKVKNCNTTAVSETVCDHPRETRIYVGRNTLRCGICGAEFE